MHFNINNKVRVKLTDHGRRAHRANYDEMMKFLGGPTASGGWPYEAPQEDAEGWSEWQMWDLMAKFGPHISHGCNPPFETEIEILEVKPYEPGPDPDYSDPTQLPF